MEIPIRLISKFGVFQRPKQSSFKIEFYNRTLLRKMNFAFLIPNPRLDCSYVVLNFLAKSGPRCSYKIVLIKTASISTSFTVREEPSPWFHVEAWLPFRSYEVDYYGNITGY